MRIFILTFDSDWVPQFILDFVVDKLHQIGFKATFFLTSSYTLKEPYGVEVALHPNFLPNSSQGSSEADILEGLTDLYPQAIGMRTHKCYWHNDLLPLVKSHGLRYDSSLVLPFHPCLEHSELGSLIRLPIWWGDNIQIMKGLDFDKMTLPNINAPGLKIFNFHPIHIYLNTADLGHYRQAMQQVDSLFDTTPESLEPWINTNKGICTFFDVLLNYLDRSSITPLTCSEYLHNVIQSKMA